MSEYRQNMYDKKSTSDMESHMDNTFKNMKNTLKNEVLTHNSYHLKTFYELWFQKFLTFLNFLKRS